MGIQKKTMLVVMLVIPDKNRKFTGHHPYDSFQPFSDFVS